MLKEILKSTTITYLKEIQRIKLDTGGSKEKIEQLINKNLSKAYEDLFNTFKNKEENSIKLVKNDIHSLLESLSMLNNSGYFSYFYNQERKEDIHNIIFEVCLSKVKVARLIDSIKSHNIEYVENIHR